MKKIKTILLISLMALLLTGCTLFSKDNKSENIDDIETTGFSIDMSYKGDSNEILNSISPTIEHFLKGISNINYNTYNKEQILDTYRDYYDKTLLTDKVINGMINSILKTKLIVEFKSFEILEIDDCNNMMIDYYGEGDYYTVIAQLDSTTVNKVEGGFKIRQVEDTSFYTILIGKKDDWKIYEFQEIDLS